VTCAPPAANGMLPGVEIRGVLTTSGGYTHKEWWAVEAVQSVCRTSTGVAFPCAEVPWGVYLIHVLDAGMGGSRRCAAVSACMPQVACPVAVHR